MEIIKRHIYKFIAALTMLAVACVNPINDSDTNSLSGDKIELPKPGAKLTNKLSLMHIKIPNTNVHISPIGGYQYFGELPGIADNKHGIRIIQKPYGMDSIRQYYTKEFYESRGIKLVHFSEFTLNGYSAIYSEVEREMYSIQLMIGDSSFSVEFLGGAKIEEKDALELQREMILSLFIKDDAQ